MKNLSRDKLRKMIVEEITKLLQDDALFSRDDLTDIGTGTIINLDNIEDETYEDEAEFEVGCSMCGADHDIDSPCGADHVDMDWQNSNSGNFVGNIDELDPEEAFGVGFAAGQSGDFD